MKTKKTETWKNIDGFSNYQVSDEGNVRNIKTGNYLKPYKSGISGYVQVRLTDDTGKLHRIYLHRLVMITFKGLDPNKPEVDHINTDKKDNRLVNLRWTTHQENINNPLTRLKFKTCHGKK